MEQLRRGVRLAAVAAPTAPDAEKAAVLLHDVAARGRTLAELSRTGEENSTAELQSRIAVRQAVRNAWAEGIEHTVQLKVLADAGLPDTASLAAADWEPALLAAIDRGQGRGRPSKALNGADSQRPWCPFPPIPGPLLLLEVRVQRYPHPDGQSDCWYQAGVQIPDAADERSGQGGDHTDLVVVGHWAAPVFGRTEPGAGRF